MPNPIGAKMGSEEHIGRRVREIAQRGEKDGDNKALVGWVERQESAPPKPEVEIKEGEPEDKKWVVIPNLDAIDSGLKNVMANNNKGYPLRVEYAKQTFELHIEALLRLVENHPNASERPIITAFLNGLEPPEDRLKKEEFFYFRLGEYCVSQCF